jgi:hypothetical protein
MTVALVSECNASHEDGWPVRVVFEFGDGQDAVARLNLPTSSTGGQTRCRLLGWDRL